jgi:hypothetical protein
MEKYTTESFEVTLHDNGIVETRIRSGGSMPDTVEINTEHALLLKKVVNGKRRGVLAVIPNLHVKRELIEIYNQANVGEAGVALLVSSFGAKVLGNLVLKARKTLKPTRLFTDRKEAEAWLLQIMAEAE